MGGRKPIDLLGQRFGRLVVGSRAENRNGLVFWNCICDCGTEKAVAASALKNGNTISCGCFHREISGRKPVHGHARKGHETATYKIWRCMVNRCAAKSGHFYKYYGARGIKVCDRWTGTVGYLNFLDDMGPRPEGLTLDRIDNDAGYAPSNCRWATLSEQRRNRGDAK